MKLKINLFLLSILFVSISNAQVTLPKYFSNDMVLQRDKGIHIWGWASVGEQIEVEFKGKRVKTKTKKDGKWEVTLPQSTFGGPYALQIESRKSKIKLNNIMVGDVWLCSGQSNMEWMVKNSNNAEREIADARYPNIRLLTVNRAMANKPVDNIEGMWKICSPETIGDFSAVGYFFGRHLFHNLDIPIGLINSSWGGTVAETWTSNETMCTVPEYEDAIKTVSTMNLEQFQNENNAKKTLFEQAMKNDIGIEEQWQHKSSIYTNNMQVPQDWNENELSTIDGSVWFKYEFYLPQGSKDKSATLSLGTIDDADVTWINGVKVGQTDGYNISRFYDIPTGVLKDGKNTIVINVLDYARGGGINGQKEKLYIDVDDQKHSLADTWKYAISVDSRNYGFSDFGPNSYPSLLYNAMIAPLVSYPIKGVIWYQGESNDNNPFLYRTLFPNLIKDWRAKWGNEFPFYWVQLANFRSADISPSESSWAEIREAQTMALSLPRTGQAITIDIGEANDIHPRNKQDVGKRLALQVLKNEYDKSSIVASGPTFRSMAIEGNKIVISLNNEGTSIKATNKYGYVQGFAIAGTDGKYMWAKAYIEEDKVYVYNDKIKNPVSVRYAWSDNPNDANLYNQEGLPTCPFRTDTK